MFTHNAVAASEETRSLAKVKRGAQAGVPNVRVARVGVVRFALRLNVDSRQSAFRSRAKPCAGVWTFCLRLPPFVWVRAGHSVRDSGFIRDVVASVVAQGARPASNACQRDDAGAPTPSCEYAAWGWGLAILFETSAFRVGAGGSFGERLRLYSGRCCKRRSAGRPPCIQRLSA